MLTLVTDLVEAYPSSVAYADAKGNFDLNLPPVLPGKLT
jgi:hypothetical protein